MTFKIKIPTIEEPLEITVNCGSSLIFVGANGGGKSKLAAHIENMHGDQAHRISAHRALSLDPNVPKITEKKALQGLRTGNENSADVSIRFSNRWRQKETSHLLNDYAYLIQVLFAEQSNTALNSHKKLQAGRNKKADDTKFDVLNKIWDKLLPHRELHISGDDIEVSAPNTKSRYNASEMSDGERALFYLIGQTLVAKKNSILIIDEPELHIHRSIMGKLWDELEAVRQDCAFIFITHDLEFAADRAAQKFVIHSYRSNSQWDIEAIPDNSGFNEETTTLILGSRKPILFVEGSANSLDKTIYRCCYPDWTVISCGSCTEVIHSVTTMKRNAQLTRINCAGIVDADATDQHERDYLNEKDVFVLSVSEIENIILLPKVSRAIAQTEGYEDTELEEKLSNLKAEVFKLLDSDENKQTFISSYCKRRTDSYLKKIDLSAATTPKEIAGIYAKKTSEFDIVAIANQARNTIKKAIENDDLTALLAIYDNKGLFAKAATCLKQKRKDDFEGWLTRVLRNDTEEEVKKEILNSLPQLPVG